MSPDGSPVNLEEAIGEIANGRDNLANRGVAEFEGLDHDFFGNFERARFDHHNRFIGTGNDDVQLARLLLGNGGIDHQLAFELAHADGGDGRGERNLRNSAD